MKIFGRHLYFRKTKRESVKLDIPRNLRTGNFAFSELISIFNLILARLKNANFQSSVDFITTREIISFIENNRLSILLNLYSNGFIVIDTKNLEIRNDYFQERVFSSEFDLDVGENDVVFLSEIFRATGRSDKNILKSKIDFIDTINNADWSLIDSYGAMGIISPDGQDVAGNILTFDKEEREAIQDDYKENYGLKLGKWKLIISKNPLKFSQINLPIKELELSEKKRSLVLDLCTYFKFPKELHPYFESSKFKNLAEAEVQCYTNCIQDYANIFTRIIELIYHQKRKTQAYLLPVDFWFDFNNVYSLEEAKHTQIMRIKEELEFWQNIKTTEPDKADVAQERIDNLIENL